MAQMAQFGGTVVILWATSLQLLIFKTIFHLIYHLGTVVKFGSTCALKLKKQAKYQPISS